MVSMLGIHRMATVTILSHSLSLLSKHSFTSSSITKCFSLSTKIKSLAYHRHGFCTSAAVASHESIVQEIDSNNDNKSSLEGGNLSEIRVKLPTNDSSETLLRIRHSCAHVMAMAVQKLYPNAKVTIGPWIDNGFFYDFDMDPITDKDLKRIKKEMDCIISRNLPLVREEVSRDEAQKRIMAQNEPYKLEILDSIQEEPITIYHIGDEWWDLCAGPHV